MNMNSQGNQTPLKDIHRMKARVYAGVKRPPRVKKAKRTKCKKGIIHNIVHHMIYLISELTSWGISIKANLSSRHGDGKGLMLVPPF